MNASERSPPSWGAGGFSGRECEPGLVPKAEGSPGGAASWCAVRVSTGGACVGVRTVASWGRVSVSERAAWGRVERDRRV